MAYMIPLARSRRGLTVLTVHDVVFLFLATLGPRPVDGQDDAAVWRAAWDEGFEYLAPTLTRVCAASRPGTGTQVTGWRDRGRRWRRGLAVGAALCSLPLTAADLEQSEHRARCA